MANDPTVQLLLQAKNLTQEAFAKVNASLKLLEDQSKRTTEQGSSGWGKLFSTIGGGVAVGNLVAKAFSSAADLIGRIPGELIELGKRGADVADVAGSFDRLTGSVGETAEAVRSKLRSAFGGTIADFDLMVSANEVLGKGVRLTADDFAILARGSRIMADSVGGDAKEAFDQMLGAIGTGQARGLKQLPVEMAAVDRAMQQYANSVGKEVSQLTDSQKQHVLRNALLSESRRLLEENGAVENDFADNVQAGSAMLQNFTDDLALAIAQSPALKAAMDVGGSAIAQAFGADRTQLVKTLTSAVNQVVIWTLEAGKAGVQTAEFLVRAWGVIQVPVRAVATAMIWATEQSVRASAKMLELAASLNPLNSDLRRAADGAKQTADYFARLREEGVKQTQSAIEMARGQDGVSLALQKTEGVIGTMIDAARKAAAATDAAGAAAETAIPKHRRHAESIGETSSQIKSLKKELEDLAFKLGSDDALYVDLNAKVEQFGKKAAEAAALAERSNLRVPDSVQKVAEAYRQLTIARLLAANDAELKAQFAEIVATLDKQQQAEGAAMIAMAVAARKYEDEKTQATLVGVDRRLAELQREHDREIVSLGARTETNARFYDERTRQIDEHYAHEIAVARGTFDTIAVRMREQGVVTRAELDAQAAAATRDYQQMRDSGLYTADQLQAAWERMIDANIAAMGGWRGSVLGVLTELPGQFSGVFAQILTGQTSFKDASTQIWSDLKQDVTKILSDLLNYFLNSFLRGMLDGLLGAKGGFSQGFASLFAGAGGGGTGGLGGGGGGGLGGMVQQQALKWAMGLFSGGGAAAITTVGGSMASTGAMGATVGWMPVTSAAPGAGMGGAAAATPWWSTSLGGGLVGGGVGAGVGWTVGSATGNVAGGALSGAGSGALTGALLGGPIGAGIGALIGGIAGWIGAKRANVKANNQRDQFFLDWAAQNNRPFIGGAQAGSTFNQVAARLTEITGEAGGGRLFQDLIKANDPKELAQAIAAVNAKLVEYEQQTRTAAEAEALQAQKIAETKAQYEAKAQVVRDQITSLDQELAKLNASEAPEEHMGTVEKQTRARIAQEKELLQAQLDDIQAQSAAAVAAIGQTAEAGAAAIGGLGEAAKDSGAVMSDAMIEAALKSHGAFDQMYRDGRIQTLGLAGEFTHLGEVSQSAFEQARQALEDLGKHLPPITIPYQYKQQGPGLPGEPPEPPPPGHAMGGVFSRPHLAAIAEGGEPEIVGSERFMTRALQGALGRLPGPSAGDLHRIGETVATAVARVLRPQRDGVDTERIAVAVAAGVQAGFTAAPVREAVNRQTRATVVDSLRRNEDGFRTLVKGMVTG